MLCGRLVLQHVPHISGAPPVLDMQCPARIPCLGPSCRGLGLKQRFTAHPLTSLRPLGLRAPLPVLLPCPQRRSSSQRPAAVARAAAAAEQLADLVASSCSSSSSTAGAAQVLQGQQFSTHALAAAQPLFDLGEGLETPVQLLYLFSLLGFLVVGAFLVVRQVLIRRELEEAAKVLGERVRANEATAEDYFELGVILLRKKLFTQATKNLERAKKGWEGEPEELAQVHNALGYALYNLEKPVDAVEEYKRALALQPGYVTAWNNMADALEVLKKYQEAYDAYQEALTYDPANKVASQRSEALKLKLDRLSLKN